MSGSVFLNNLDDFIVPSQACVNPLVAPKLNQDTQTETATAAAAQGVSVHVRANSKKHGRVTLANDFSSSDLLDFSLPAVPLSAPSTASALPPVVQPDLIKARTTSGNAQKTVATVSLNDCLACSGCVTSAESILIQEQSNDKFLRLLDERDPDTVIVVQISPNSRASIADFLEMNVGEFFVRVAAMLKSLGVRYVLDAAAGNDVALVESREEFMHRLQNGRSKEWTKPETTIAQSSSSVQIVDSGAVVDAPVVAVPSHLPLLVSHCPGWVCYAEKTSPQAIPYMSTVKSAQQIVGTIVKNLIFSSVEMRHAGRDNDSTPSRSSTDMQVDGERDDEERALAQALQQLSVEDLDLDKHTGRCSPTHNESGAGGATFKKVIVVSIQPCFDKKLEASRKDFYHSDNGVNEVDLVLSTTELWQIIELYAFRWANNGELEPDRYTSSARAPMDFDDPSASSGKKLRRNEDQEENDLAAMDIDADEDPRRFLLRKRSSSLRAQSFQNVLAFLHSFAPDASEGEDEIERLFRCVSHTGEEILSAAERNAGSGGYSEYLFKSCAEKLYGLSLWGETLQYIAGRNPDYAELDITQYVSPEQIAQARAPPKLKFARAYGFRNIQSLLMKMKRGAADVDLVEISACPSGCNNGGGQLRALSSMVSLANSSGAPPRSETSGESKERVGRVEALFHGQLRVRRPEESPLVRFLYHETRLGAPLSEAARRVLHTRYHAVPKLEIIAPLAAKW